jgi:hypothetical protein
VQFTDSCYGFHWYEALRPTCAQDMSCVNSLPELQCRITGCHKKWTGRLQTARPINTSLRLESFQPRQRKIELDLLCHINKTREKNGVFFTWATSVEILLTFGTPHPSARVLVRLGGSSLSLSTLWPPSRPRRPSTPTPTPSPGDNPHATAHRSRTNRHRRRGEKNLRPSPTTYTPRLVPCSPPPVPSGICPHIQVRARLASATDSALVRQATSVYCKIWFRKLLLERVMWLVLV